jgi:hypothetical protein
MTVVIIDNQLMNPAGLRSSDWWVKLTNYIKVTPRHNPNCLFSSNGKNELLTDTTNQTLSTPDK